tara:strand:+ start:574 stop:1008 length:435 start_codon:yes stop_codon:yes gene_type:complete
MKIFIENPSGTRIKKEFIEESNAWIEKNEVAVPYPYPYGFIPGTMQEDEDPLDVFLVTTSLFDRGDTPKVEVIGLVEFYEDDERDYKIICKLPKEDVTVNETVKKLLTHFMMHAFDNQKDKKVRVGEFYGKDIAMKEIEKCRVT